MMLFKIKRINYIIIGLFLVQCITSVLLFIRLQQDLNQDILLDKAINEIRVRINPTYEYILKNIDQSNLSDDDKLTTLLEKESLNMVILSPSGIVAYSNHNTIQINDVVDLKQFLYYDVAYSKNQTNTYKIAFPLIKENQLLGNIVFLLSKNDIFSSYTRPMYINVYIIFTIINLMIIFILYIVRHTQIKSMNIHFNELNMALLSVAKGNFKPLPLKNNLFMQVYSTYNTMVEELSYVLKKQQAYDEERKQFLSTISHELKTPLSAIIAYVEGLKNNIAKTETEREKYIAVIHTKILKLSNQIEELFKFSQQSINEFKFNLVECYANRVFDRLLAPIIKQFESSPIQLTINNAAPSCLINVDEIRIEQVIQNFVNNATKHVKAHGKIHIAVYREDNEMIVSVYDNGCGIDPKDLPYIFDYFYQGSKEKSNDYEGAGLGLAICKYIVEHHNGKIFVKSGLNTGSEFRFSLPVV